jgi:hypothetical protein
MMEEDMVATEDMMEEDMVATEDMMEEDMVATEDMVTGEDTMVIMVVMVVMIATILLPVQADIMQHLHHEEIVGKEGRLVEDLM